jgi:hypothetical protein
MPNVWWLRGKGQRIISVADWALAGIATDEAVIWNDSNHFSVDQATLSSDQINFLRNDVEFLADQTGLPSGVVVTPPAFPPPYFTRKQASGNLMLQERYVEVDATSAAVTLNLPTAVGNTGKQYTFKRIDASTNLAKIQAQSGQNIDGIAAQFLVFQGHLLTIMSDGANWIELQSNYCGRELGYAEVTGPINSTNTLTTDVALEAAVITGLSVTAVGTGRPVKIDFRTMAANSIDGAGVAANLLINGSTSLAPLAVMGAMTKAGNYGTGSIFKSLLLTAGVSYTFEVGMWVLSGTGSYAGNQLLVIGA